VKETGLDPKIEAIQNAGRVYAEQQNHGVDQELWDKFGSAPLKVEGGSYVPFPEKIDWSKAPEGATHILEGFLLNPNFVFCRKDADGEWRWWSDIKAMWFVIKTNEDFYVRLKELPAPQSTMHTSEKPTALDVQVGGGHYKSFAIQPVEFIQRNKLGFCEGNAIKYLCRHKEKGGAEDIKKVIHYCELLLQLEYGQ